MLTGVLWVVSVVVLVTTLLPLTNSLRWWVRMWDFPRQHIAVVALVVAVTALWSGAPSMLPMMGLMSAVFVYQAVRIFPYTPLARTEIDLVVAPVPADQITMMSENVLMENTRHDDLARIIHRETPDVLFLMETDNIWADALNDVLAGYPTVRTHLLDNHYGLIFATRLEVVKIDVTYPDQTDTPMIKAVLRAPNGADFNFIGLHPRPPVPGNSTAERDRQINQARRPDDVILGTSNRLHGRFQRCRLVMDDKAFQTLRRLQGSAGRAGHDIQLSYRISADAPADRPVVPYRQRQSCELRAA